MILRRLVRGLRGALGLAAMGAASGTLHCLAAPYALESTVLPAGGGLMQSARFTVTGSAGQAVASARASSGTNLAGRAGFWNRVSRWLPVLQVPVAMEAYLDTRRAVPGLRLYDLDSGPTPVELRISVTNGVLTLATGVEGGVGPASVSGNGTGSIQVIASAAAVARTLGFAGSLEYQPAGSYVGPDAIAFRLEASGLDPGGIIRADATVPVDVRFRPTVVGRWVFYNQSAWDGKSAAANAADDNAIATDKAALLPGIMAGFVNYTSYSRGLNGIMVDISGVPAGGTPTAADFEFRTGNDDSPAGWSIAPAPMSVSLRRGAGVGGSDRVTLIWGSNAVTRAWLGIRVLANATTGLEIADQFYFGNAVGEAGNADGVDAVVNETDEILARQNARGPFSPAGITFVHDHNRDRLVDVTDQLIARANVATGSSALRLIVPAAGSGGGLAGPVDPERGEVRLVAWRDAAGWVVLEGQTGRVTDVEWSLEASEGGGGESRWVEVARGLSSRGRVSWRIRAEDTRASRFYRLVSGGGEGGPK